ncbi:hypothetical protein DVH24_025947 [Malus domestica]|uniref:Uncharacterized protein n=1 Tax=Malus domestica TaxID=3750 RepID=A0A498KI14_MALDO|nr:hypothetical protein DVH24_025947 [Malus domestica]
MLADVDNGDDDSWSSGMKTLVGEDGACTHNSVELLRHQGIDFERIQDFEVDLIRFTKLMMSSSRLVCNDAEGGGGGKRRMEHGKDEHDGW